ncbi:ABC transporter permease [Desulfobacula phenolica]|uniref:Putative ABC transport system permease protein n=1 Tax=Desulfobacula phenolica TaxID=90732 RepID=A0A1H2JQ34_9BACT|nr:FtsX-like permease family protein [Desulfobacula phenolica]SDU58609.1 putative ABC transport system permease protein [Desulfobacula phenolica]
MLWIRMGVRELIKNRGFALFFILNLSLGLAGFIAIHSFGRSLDRHMDENLKEILTADLVVSSNRALTPEDLALVDKVFENNKTLARLVSFYTMVKAGPNARLVKIMAIDTAYPLYGDFSLEKQTLKANIQNSPGVFMTRDTAYALGLRDNTDENTPLKLGDKMFVVRDYFVTDPDKSLTAVELAPKIYMGIEQLEGTGLIRFGSRIRYSRFYRFGRDADVPLLAQTLRQEFARVHPGQPMVNVHDSRDINQRLGRLTGYFTGYMGLVSVVTLFLAGIATAYLFRGYLNLKQREIAILMSIGARHREIYLYISFQLFVLGTLASVLAIFVSLFLVPAFPVIFQGLIPDQVRLATDFNTILLALGLGMTGSLIFCLPVFVRIFGVKPVMLFGGTHMTATKNSVNLLLRIASVLPGLAAFLLISVFAAGSVKNGSIFVGGFVLALAFLSAVGRLLFSGCKHLSNTRYPVVKIAFRNLFRNKWASLSCFVTIAMGAFLISLIPQVQKGLQNEIVRPEGLKIPVFFLVDIQDEQKIPFMEFIRNQDAKLVNLSPMVRGRILTKNQESFYGETRPSGSGYRGRGRRLEFNFSYRPDLDVSETIVQGLPLSKIPWEFESQTPFEVSVEHSFARRYDLEIGDLLGFEIQGIPLQGRVKNLRKVRWNSFSPNFFLLFQDGVLNTAPKTFLAAVSQVPPAKRQDLKNKIVDAFPNVSVIDVTQMAMTLLDITDRLSLSIRFMAWLAIAAGLVSIFSIARHQARKNENQINLLKVLGSDFKAIQAINLLEFGFIGFTAALFAILLSYVFSWAVSWYFFDSLWKVNLILSFLILVLTTCICMGAGFAASRKVMNSKPVKLLTNAE